MRSMKVAWSFTAMIAFIAFFKTTECTIGAWAKPVISAATGSGTLTEKINNGVASGTATGITIEATGTITAYAKTSQTPASPVLAIDNSGVVTVTSGTVSYSTSTSLVMVVTATDADGTTSATVTINVNAAPAITAPSDSTPCIADASTEGTDLIDLAATDSNSGTTFTWAIASGNTNTDFEVLSSGLVQVASGKTLAKSTTASYTLVITAADDSTTALLATATVTASVQTTCSSSSAAIAISLMTLLAALLVTKLS